MLNPIPYAFLRFLAVIALFAAFSAPTVLVAQETQRVAAVVNEEIITLHDLEQRMRLVMLSSNLPDTVESRSRIGPQVLRRLIDERLEMQEAQRLKITVPSGELNNAVMSIARQNKIPEAQFEPFLKSRGVEIETLRQQLRAQLAWISAVRNELMPSLHIGEEEIDERLKTIKANLGKPEYLAADIFLPVEDPSHEEETLTLAQKLLDQMRQGAPFSALAREFSQTGAAAGGDLGWVSEGMLDDELTAALARLEVGRASPPIRTPDGYHIVLLRDKRTVGDTTNNQPTLDIAQIILNALPSSTSADRKQQAQHVTEVVAGATTCDEYMKRIKEIPTAEWMHTGKLMATELPAEVQPLISPLKAGEMSQPYEQEEQTRFFVICGRTDPVNGLPTREDVRRRIEDEQMDIMARRYLRDLRRAAFVEIRA